MAAIYDASTRTSTNSDATVVASSFGNKLGESFSIEDASLDLKIDCSSK